MKEVINLKGNTERVALDLVKKKGWGLKRGECGLTWMECLPHSPPLLFLPRDQWSWLDGGESSSAHSLLHLCWWQLHPSLKMKTLRYPSLSSFFMQPESNPSGNPGSFPVSAFSHHLHYRYHLDPSHYSFGLNSFLVSLIAAIYQRDSALALPKSIFNTTARMAPFKRQLRSCHSFPQNPQGVSISFWMNLHQSPFYGLQGSTWYFWLPVSPYPLPGPLHSTGPLLFFKLSKHTFTLDPLL